MLSIADGADGATGYPSCRSRLPASASKMYRLVGVHLRAPFAMVPLDQGPGNILVMPAVGRRNLLQISILLVKGQHRRREFLTDKTTHSTQLPFWFVDEILIANFQILGVD